jgi:hypothetical protein
MLNVKTQGGQIQITATCQVCNLDIPCPAEATLAYKPNGDPSPKLIHQQQCLKTFKERHRNYKFIRAGYIFRQLGY